MKIKPSGRAGFTLTEVMIVTGIIGLLAEIAIPNLLEGRSAAHRSSCINNLRQIDDAKQQWAFAELHPPNQKPTADEIAVYLWHGVHGDDLSCPTDPAHKFDSSYDPGDLMTTPACKQRPDSHILP